MLEVTIVATTKSSADDDERADYHVVERHVPAVPLPLRITRARVRAYALPTQHTPGYDNARSSLCNTRDAVGPWASKSAKRNTSYKP